MYPVTQKYWSSCNYLMAHIPNCRRNTSREISGQESTTHSRAWFSNCRLWTITGTAKSARCNLHFVKNENKIQQKISAKHNKHCFGKPVPVTDTVTKTSVLGCHVNISLAVQSTLEQFWVEGWKNMAMCEVWGEAGCKSKPLNKATN